MGSAAHEDEISRGSPPGPALSAGEAALFSQHLADLTQASLPMPDGLRALADEMPGRGFQRLARDLADRIQAGESLAAALEQLGGRLPTHVRALLLAGIRSGQAPQVLSQLVATNRLAADLRRSVWLGLLYPVILLALLSVIFGACYALLVPQFQAIFDDFNIPLPWITRVILATSASVRSGLESAGWRLLVAFLAIALAWRLMLDRRSRRWVICHVPFAGALWRWAALSEYCQYLALLLEVELPGGEATILAAQATNDAELAYESGHIARDLERGRSLSEAVAGSPVFPLGVAELLRWAEDREALVASLRTLGEILAAQARSRAALVSTMTLVLVVVLLLWGGALTILGLMLPLIQLISRLSG